MWSTAYLLQARCEFQRIWYTLLREYLRWDYPQEYVRFWNPKKTPLLDQTKMLEITSKNGTEISRVLTEEYQIIISLKPKY